MPFIGQMQCKLWIEPEANNIIKTYSIDSIQDWSSARRRHPTLYPHHHWLETSHRWDFAAALDPQGSFCRRGAPSPDNRASSAIRDTIRRSWNWGLPGRLFGSCSIHSICIYREYSQVSPVYFAAPSSDLIRNADHKTMWSWMLIKLS